MELRLDINGLDALTRSVVNLPGDFARARASALKSTGWWIRGELRNHIEYGGGSDWPAQHPMTQKFKKKYGVGNRWFGRQSWGHETPLFWLGKFARYRLHEKVVRGDEYVRIDFGKSRAKQLGTFDDELIGIVGRAEHGERVTVTPAMRRFFGATRRKRPKTQIPGQTYFPLRGDTTALDIPKRPIFAPVWRKVEPLIPGQFAEKFWGALDRYQTGTPKK